MGSGWLWGCTHRVGSQEVGLVVGSQSHTYLNHGGKKVEDHWPKIYDLYIASAIYFNRLFIN